MKGAGSSYGVTTEFLYKIFLHPEPMPLMVPLYVKGPEIFEQLLNISKEGRFDVSLGISLITSERMKKWTPVSEGLWFANIINFLDWSGSTIIGAFFTDMQSTERYIHSTKFHILNIIIVIDIRLLGTY